MSSQLFSVSVIIPVYNAEIFLQKAIESVIKQPEVSEIILVEDASPDDCITICRKYSEKYPHIKLFQHPDKKNHGAAVSYNLGIKKSTSKYIAILGADDYYLENRFKRDREILTIDATIDGVYNAIEAYAVDENGKQRFDTRNSILTTVTENISPEDIFFKMGPIGTSGYFSLDGLTVKKEALLKVGLMDPILRLSQDTHISMKLAAACKLAPGQIEKPVARFALHQNNRSQYNDLIHATRPYIFHDLFLWARKESLPKDKVFLLWQRFYEHTLIVENIDRKSQRKLLFKELVSMPLLITSAFFRKQLPVLSRF